MREQRRARQHHQVAHGARSSLAAAVVALVVAGCGANEPAPSSSADDGVPTSSSQQEPSLTTSSAETETAEPIARITAAWEDENGFSAQAEVTVSNVVRRSDGSRGEAAAADFVEGCGSSNAGYFAAQDSGGFLRMTVQAQDTTQGGFSYSGLLGEVVYPQFSPDRLAAGAGVVSTASGLLGCGPAAIAGAGEGSLVVYLSEWFSPKRPEGGEAFDSADFYGISPAAEQGFAPPTIKSCKVTLTAQGEALLSGRPQRSQDPTVCAFALSDGPG